MSGNEQANSSASHRTLYLVGTPLGNLEDITLRALRILREVDLVAAEDTRNTKKLFSHYEIHTPITSYHEHNKTTKTAYLLEQLQSKDIAVVSDSGMPGLSDPGYELVVAAVAHGIRVVPIPGPTAPITALVASGLPTDSFTYLGFLSRRATARRSSLQAVKNSPHSLIIFEAPHRLLNTLNDIREILGDREVAVGRELTKMYEEIWRGAVSEAIEHFTATAPRGEFTLVIAGAVVDDQWTENRVRAAVKELRAEGTSAKDTAREVSAASGWSKRNVYEIAIE